MKANDIGVYINPINTVAFEVREALQTPAITTGIYHIEWLTITYRSPVIHSGARSIKPLRKPIYARGQIFRTAGTIFNLFLVRYLT